MRRILFFCLILWTAHAAAQGGHYVISAKNAEPMASEDRLRAQVEFLSDTLCAGRQTGTEGSTWAIAWIGNRMDAIGLDRPGDFRYHGFRTDNGKTAHNVAGLLPGRGGQNRKYVIVTAHFDHIGTLSGTLYPGADSNASGVAALLSLADMFQYMKELGRTWSRSSLFVALDAKEQSLGGSLHLWDQIDDGLLVDPDTRLPISRKDIELVVNIDQVGSTLSPLHPDRPDYLIMLSDERSGRREALSFINRSNSLFLDLGFSYYGSKDFTQLFYRRISDQKPFLDHGIPSVMFTSGITLNNNKPYDNAASLDYAVLRKRVLLMYYYLARIL